LSFDKQWRRRDFHLFQEMIFIGFKFVQELTNQVTAKDHYLPMDDISEVFFFRIKPFFWCEIKNKQTQAIGKKSIKFKNIQRYCYTRQFMEENAFF
jgi:hypothetical protein